MSKIKDRFLPPAGWQWGGIGVRSGQFLRVGWCARAHARGLCVIFPGLSEFSEKYFETAHDLLHRGFAVAVMDWRGQGLSWRHLPGGDCRHHDDFAMDVEDAFAFLAFLDSLPEMEGLPRLVLGHSMGGHIALRVMHDAPASFCCAVLSAPMFGINFPHYMEGTARLTAEAACRFGLAGHYVPGAGPWSMASYVRHLDFLTSDTDRRAMTRDWLEANPALRCGGVTFGWLRAAMASSRLTQNPDWLGRIKAPVLSTLNTRDVIISNEAIARGVRMLPKGRLLELDGALHEILMERDIFRDVFWLAFDGFIADHVKERVD